MKWIRYLQYFVFISYNWGIRIAIHILHNEIRGEKKYGISSTGYRHLHHLQKKGIDTRHATMYMPISFDLLEELFAQIKIAQCKHLVDIGCGKGRALCVAAALGTSKVTGIDFSKQFCKDAEKNLAGLAARQQKLQYKIVHNDAFYFEIPDDVDCIFMFNPFDEVIMSGVVENIVNSLKRTPRQLSIIYANPLEKQLFLEQGFCTVYHTQKMKYLEAIILQKPA